MCCSRQTGRSGFCSTNGNRLIRRFADAGKLHAESACCGNAETNSGGVQNAKTHDSSIHVRVHVSMSITFIF